MTWPWSELLSRQVPRSLQRGGGGLGGDGLRRRVDMARARWLDEEFREDQIGGAFGDDDDPDKWDDDDDEDDWEDDDDWDDDEEEEEEDEEDEDWEDDD